MAKQGTVVRVIDLFCVKPLDAAALLEAARACDNRILTVEDHYPEGGLGDAVMEAVGTANVAVHRLAVRETVRPRHVAHALNVNPASKRLATNRPMGDRGYQKQAKKLRVLTRFLPSY